MLLLFFKSFINELISSVENKRCECLQVRVWVSTVSALGNLLQNLMCSTSEIMSWSHELTSGRNHLKSLGLSFSHEWGHRGKPTRLFSFNVLGPPLTLWSPHPHARPSSLTGGQHRMECDGWADITIFGTVSGWDMSLIDQAKLGSQFFHGNKVLKAG